MKDSGLTKVKPVLQVLTVLAWTITVTAGAFAQEPRIPAGNWQSPGHATYTNPALTGAEMYLNIEVAKDGSFRGVWGQYFCNSYPGAYGISIYSCSKTGSNRVSGRLGQDRRGVIELQRLGRSAFSWSAPNANELAIDLPKNWQGDPATLYRARLTRDGKGKPTASSAPASNEGPLLSSVALYREFNKNSAAAFVRYGGKTLVLEGRRGTVVAPLSDGGAAIHIADGSKSRALVLRFRDLREVSEIGEGARFRFRCVVTMFDYGYVHMENCTIVP